MRYPRVRRSTASRARTLEERERLQRRAWRQSEVNCNADAAGSPAAQTIRTGRARWAGNRRVGRCLCSLLGFAWHSHHVKIRSKIRAAAALAQAKQRRDGAVSRPTPAAAGKSGAEVEAPAHGNNSGATPAQAAQKIQQQTGAPSVSAATVNNATASSVPFRTSLPPRRRCSLRPHPSCKHARSRLSAEQEASGAAETSPRERAERRGNDSGKNCGAASAGDSDMGEGAGHGRRGESGRAD